MTHDQNLVTNNDEWEKIINHQSNNNNLRIIIIIMVIIIFFYHCKYDIMNVFFILWSLPTKSRK